jgi:glutamate synthase domain-containing protein 3
VVTVSTDVAETSTETTVLDLEQIGVRGVNSALRALPAGSRARLLSPAGRHNLAVGLDTPIEVVVAGTAGYYAGALGKQASVTVEGTAGTGVGENLMSGLVHVRGDASQSAAASAHGGTVRVDGSASMRAGISLKGATLVVAGDVGPFCGFMAQAGTILIGGDAGHDLGDSLYEAIIYVAGRVASLGTDAEVQELSPADLTRVRELVAAHGLDIDPQNVTRIGSARRLYHFATHNSGAY